MFSWVSHSEKETLKFGRSLAKFLKGGEILALVGSLGSGKTTFLKGLARGLNLKTRVASPSFVIMSRHLLSGKKREFFYHFDLYRLKRQSELAELGFLEILENPKNIVAVEWANRAKKSLPKRTIIIKFEHGQDHNERRISIDV